ncbi:MAG: IS66 family insertion sequence element accessory protein TnpA [Lachnospira sp.]
MECRQSGLSDYQWCQRQDINVGTFYNWVSKLRKAGYTIPDSKSKSEGAVVVQDVVKVNLVSEGMSSSVIEQNTRPIAAASTPSVAAELVAGNVTLRLFNGADQNLIRCAMQCMGGATHAW